MASLARSSFVSFVRPLLASAFTAALVAACGGKVIFDGPGDGQGGQGGGQGGAGAGPPCADFQTVCSGECVDTQKDALHCGGCGNHCKEGPCVAGNCMGGEPPCQDPLSYCNGNCVNLATDPEHCGACNDGCPPDAVCIDGDC
jgi:hypothetical protein